MDIPILRCHDLTQLIGKVVTDEHGTVVHLKPESKVILGVLLQSFQVVEVLESIDEGPNRYITKARVIAFSIDPDPVIPATTEVSQTNLGPNDVIVLTAQQELSPHTCERLTKYLQETWPGRTCIVLSDGLKLSILRQQPDKPANEE